MTRWFFSLLLLVSFSGFSQQNEIEKSKNKFNQFIDVHGGHVKTKHTHLHYLQWGCTNQKTLIWLHGSLSNAFEIEPFAKDIIKLGYRIIAIDYYGHGSTKIPADKFSATDLLQDINTLLDSLHIPTCTVGGFSRGAYLATMFYNKYPQKVDALILEDGGVSPFLEHFTTLSSEQLKTKVDEEIQNRPAELFEEYDHEEEAYCALEPYGETNKNQRYKNFSFIRFNKGKYVIYKDIDKLYGLDSYENISLLTKGKLFSNPFANELMLFPYYDIIATTTVPTLLLEASSKNDPFPNTSYYLNLKRTNNNITYNTFAKSDHTIHHEEPRKFIKALTKFLKYNDN
ncbi:alpha/beta fold hydrolase [Sphingobacterium rhinopitheci]|uniref:alpha/beta fold hydrolase n=1 Tax=Sphingobacterium rhinopitheci TaxID=2781960 RepID=UPI001F51D2A6|nr:alpha/beta hydrolase [Sphingobacterium rhinopitheci]MCI0920467.1 alpha/beta hydrolase [Sphingobacterium rhinopitheci]